MPDRFDVAAFESHCEELQYPMLRADAAAAFADFTVTVADADDEVNVGVVISELGCDSFSGPEELYEEVTSALDSW